LRKRKSLRKHLKSNIKAEKISGVAHLHLVEGQHNHTHSITPISASEVEKLEAINPDYVKELFSIINKSMELEKEEMNRYFDAIQKEQENDELAIIAEDAINSKQLKYATSLIIVLVIASAGFAYYGFKEIAYAIIGTLLIAIINGIFRKKDTKK
jgi:hypothetical protein